MTDSPTSRAKHEGMSREYLRALLRRVAAVEPTPRKVTFRPTPVYATVYEVR